MNTTTRNAMMVREYRTPIFRRFTTWGSNFRERNLKSSRMVSTSFIRKVMPRTMAIVTTISWSLSPRKSFRS